MDPKKKKIFSTNQKFFAERIKLNEAIDYTVRHYPNIISGTDAEELYEKKSVYWKITKFFDKFTSRADGFDIFYDVLKATEQTESVLKTLDGHRYERERRHVTALGKSSEDTATKFEVVTTMTQNTSERASKVQDPVTTSPGKSKYSVQSKGLPQTRLPLPPISPRNVVTLDADTKVKGEKVTQVPRDNLKPQRNERAEEIPKSGTMKTQASAREKEATPVLAAHRKSPDGQEGKPLNADNEQRKRPEEVSVFVADQNAEDIQKRQSSPQDQHSKPLEATDTTPNEKQITGDTKYDDEAKVPMAAFKDQQSLSFQVFFDKMMAEMNEQGKRLMKAQDEKFAALSKDVKDLGYRLDAFKDTIAKKMDMFEYRLIALEKVLKEAIDEKTAPLKEELETLKQLFISLEDSVQQLQQSQDILQAFSAFRDKLFKLLDMDIPRIRGDIDELRTDFTNLKHDTTIMLSEMREHDTSGNQQKHDIIRSIADRVLEDDVRRIAQKIKGIRQELAKLLGAQMCLTENEKGSMDDEGQAEAVLTSWMLEKAGKGEQLTWGELIDTISKINSDIAKDVDTLRNN